MSGCASLLFGAVLGLGLMFGLPVYLALEGLSIFWLIGSSFTLNLFAKPLATRNDILARALKADQFASAVFYVWIMPWAISFAIQSAIYGSARWIWR